MVKLVKYHDELLELAGARITFSRAISRLTPAPLINLYVGIIFSLASPIGLGPYLSPLQSVLICILIMVILPISPIVLEAWRGNVDLDVSNRESRTKFFVFSMMCYVLAFVVYGYFRCHIMSTLAAAYFSVTFGVLLVSLRWKISVHGAGIGGPGAALIYVYGPIALSVIFVWAMVIYSRVTLKQHTLLQSIAGVLIAVIISWTTYVFLYGL
jgi:membrane-associated phospholipid phosphatase